MKTEKFQKLVWDFYEDHGRDELPWRNTDDPYAIYISEMMLQQTQATRVIPKYRNWLDTFSDFAAVKEAEKAEILKNWQGLGYNRRAIYIKRSCETIVLNHDGKLPQNKTDLLALPGVGPYTAGALLAFVYDKPVVFVETNIRTAIIHHFFQDQEDISDETIKKQVEKTLPDKDIRTWYKALMDYGHHLKSEVGNLNRQSSAYQKQSKFSGSNRQLRSKLTHFVLDNEPTSVKNIKNEFSNFAEDHGRMKSIETNLKILENEGFLTITDSRIETAN